MALTISDVAKGPAEGGFARGLVCNIVEVTGDASYAAGGYTLTPSSFGLSSIVGVVPISSTGVLVPVWDRAAGKLKFIKGATSTTVTTGSGGFSEAATNDTYASTAKAVLLVVGRA